MVAWSKAVLLLAFMAILQAEGAQLGGPWAKYGADMSNGGHASVRGPTIYTGSCQWTYVGKVGAIHDPTACSPVLWETNGQNTVYAAFPGELHAVSVELQEKRWKISTQVVTNANTLSSQLLVTSGGLVWMGGMNGVLRAKDSGSDAGPEIAYYLPEDHIKAHGFVAGPALSTDGDMVFFGTTTGELYSFSTTATPVMTKWVNDDPCRIRTNASITTMPAVHPTSGTLFIACGNYFAGVNPATGDNLWHAKMPIEAGDVRGVLLEPGLNPSVAYLTTSGGVVLALDLESHDVLWSASASNQPLGQPAISSDGALVFFGSEDGGLYRVSTALGDPKLLYHTTLPIYGAPVVDESGAIFISSSDGRLYGLDDEGALLSTLVLPSSDLRTSAVFGSDGSIYGLGFESMFIFVPEPCKEFHSDDTDHEWYYWFAIMFFPIAGGVLLIFALLAFIVWVRKRKLTRQLEEDLLINSDEASSWEGSYKAI